MTTVARRPDAVDDSPLHVGLNLIFLVPGDTGGMEVAARELIPALVAAAPPGVRLTAFVSLDAGPGPWDELTAKVEVPVHAADRVARVRGELQLLPRLARAAGVDLVHSLASTGPISGRFVRVVTVHDLIYRRFPETHAGIRALGMRVLVPLTVRRSDRVLADSESTRDDLVGLLGVARERIDVVPLGVGSRVNAAPMPEAEVRRRLGLGDRRVLLSLSAKRPHKNIEALLDALASMPERPMLVIAGYATAHERTLRARASALGLDDDVRWAGWLDPAELEGLWTISSAFVFPSLYEGFGLPVLEAMVRGVPVACSNASSLPEVAGDAALLFDPRNSAQIAVALQRLLSDAQLVARLRRAGTDRAAQFTWERTAQAVLASYRRALSGA
ncbi:MAG: glycosyltransferase family 1 protein [Solirubrobacteraceae bacterium]|jgi:glycosyltransferase involved in cell wall biosynthesis